LAVFYNKPLLFFYKNIAHYHEQLHKGTTTCLEAVKYYLKKIEETKKLNAFVAVYEDESIARAKFLDKKRKNDESTGRLHGVVIAIKDVICYKDHEVTAASGILKNFISVYNSTAVENLLKEGAIIIGNCNCDEFAMGSTNENSVYGRVLNALDETKFREAPRVVRQLQCRQAFAW
jgi:aspartyl-tRNA(Asn)/glutamyl-tRNA(Gln) amidotransferase subunit A